MISNRWQYQESDCYCAHYWEYDVPDCILCFANCTNEKKSPWKDRMFVSVYDPRNQIELCIVKHNQLHTWLEFKHLVLLYYFNIYSFMPPIYHLTFTPVNVLSYEDGLNSQTKHTCVEQTTLSRCAIRAA